MKKMSMAAITAFSALVIVIAGCNMFEWMHPEGHTGDSVVMLSDADTALLDGEYKKAIDLYEQVLVSDPDNSQAMVGHASASMQDAGFDVFGLIASLAGGDPFDMTNYENFGVDSIAELGDLADTLIADLEPIINGQADGAVQPDNLDVNLALTIAYMAAAASFVVEEGLTGFDYDGTNWTAPAGMTQKQKNELVSYVEGATITIGNVAGVLELDIDGDGVNDLGSLDLTSMMDELKCAIDILLCP